MGEKGILLGMETNAVRCSVATITAITAIVLDDGGINWPRTVRSNCRSQPSCRSHAPKISGYSERVVPTYSQIDFRKYFWMSRSTFEVKGLLMQFPGIPHEQGKAGWPRKTTGLHCSQCDLLLVTLVSVNLQYLSVLCIVCGGLKENIAVKIITWPARSIYGTQNIWHFPHLLDLFLIHTYRFNSLRILLMVRVFVCDYQMVFTDCCAGSMHDVKVLGGYHGPHILFYM